MANKLYDHDRSYVTEFKYDLRERGDELTDSEIESIRNAVLEWGVQNDMPVEFRATRRGFAVEITHPVENGDAFGMSLFLHLSAGVFRDLETNGGRSQWGPK